MAENAIAIPVTDAVTDTSLRGVLETLGIKTIDPAVVRAIKREAVADRLPYVGYFFMVVTNGYLTALAAVLSIWLASLSGWWIAFGVIGSFIAGVWFLGWRVEFIRDVFKELGPQWRESRLLGKDRYGYYQYRGDYSYLMSSVPPEANEIIERVGEMPGTFVTVEWTQKDPFLLVTRVSLRHGIERERVFQWI